MKSHIADVIEEEQKHLDTLGWYSHCVPCDDDQTPYGFNYHTHGIVEKFNHPDFQIVIPLPPKAAHSIMCPIVDAVKEGSKFEADKEYEGYLKKGLKIKFINAMESNRPVLRLILPDKEGNLDIDKIAKQFKDQYQDVRTDY